MIVSPDAGRVKTARNFARRIGTQWAVMEKERPAQAVAEIGYVVGNVKGKTAVLVDDMIATVVTDTLPLRPGAPDNITVLSTASTFADSIRRIFTDDSVSEIFAGENQLF